MNKIEEVDAYFKKNFGDIYVGASEYVGVEDGKESIVVFVKCDRNPYRLIKRIIAKMFEDDFKYIDDVVIMPR